MDAPWLQIIGISVFLTWAAYMTVSVMQLRAKNRQDD